MTRTRKARGWDSRNVGDRLQFATERLGAELAERVAKVEPRLRVRQPDAERARDPFGHPAAPAAAPPASTLLASAPSAAKSVRTGPVRVRHPVMDVEQQRPDPVVELARDRVALAREMPAGLLGGGVGVVGPGEDDLVEALAAERRRAVAVGVEPPARSSRPRRRTTEHDRREQQKRGERAGTRTGRSSHSPRTVTAPDQRDRGPSERGRPANLARARSTLANLCAT